MHEHYDVLHFLDLDVGVVVINGNLLSAPGAQLIALNHIEPPVQSAVEVSGWGRLTSGGANPDFLQWTTVNVVDRDDCLAAYTANITLK